MHIKFSLVWQPNPRSLKQMFKSSACYELFEIYLKRISQFCRAEASGILTQKTKPVVWLCDVTEAKRALRSEEIAQELEKLIHAGTRELEIVIGGADGFDPKQRKHLVADRIWSFGPITLPHELAAVVAAEQIYRAGEILRNGPYHK